MAILVTLVLENSFNRSVTDAESNASMLKSSVSLTSLFISCKERERNKLSFIGILQHQLSLEISHPEQWRIEGKEPETPHSPSPLPLILLKHKFRSAEKFVLVLFLTYSLPGLPPRSFPTYDEVWICHN